MRFKVTTYVQVSRTFEGESEGDARRRIWLAIDEALKPSLLGEHLVEDFVVTIPERLTILEDVQFPEGLLVERAQPRDAAELDRRPPTRPPVQVRWCWRNEVDELVKQLAGTFPTEVEAFAFTEREGPKRGIEGYFEIVDAPAPVLWKPETPAQLADVERQVAARVEVFNPDDQNEEPVDDDLYLHPSRRRRSEDEL